MPNHDILLRKFGSIWNWGQLPWGTRDMMCPKHMFMVGDPASTLWTLGRSEQHQTAQISEILVQFGTGVSWDEAPGKFDASKIYAHDRWPHIRSREPLVEARSFKFRKSAEFCFKILVQFETGVSHEAPGKSASKMYVHTNSWPKLVASNYKDSRISLQKCETECAQCTQKTTEWIMEERKPDLAHKRQKRLSSEIWPSHSQACWWHNHEQQGRNDHNDGRLHPSPLNYPNHTHPSPPFVLHKQPSHLVQSLAGHRHPPLSWSTAQHSRKASPAFRRLWWQRSRWHVWEMPWYWIAQNKCRKMMVGGEREWGHWGCHPTVRVWSL